MAQRWIVSGNQVITFSCTKGEIIRAAEKHLWLKNDALPSTGDTTGIIKTLLTNLDDGRAVDARCYFNEEGGDSVFVSLTPCAGAGNFNEAVEKLQHMIFGSE